jgi:hypothetical protein
MSAHTKTLVYRMIFWLLYTILIGFFTFPLVMTFYPYYSILSLTIGIVAGVAFGYLFEKRILRIIEKKGQYGSNSSVSLGESLGMAIFILIIIFGISARLAPFVSVKDVGLIFLFALSEIPASCVVSVRVVKQWEKKNQMKILNDTYLLAAKRIYVLPPPPPPLK